MDQSPQYSPGMEPYPMPMSMGQGNFQHSSEGALFYQIDPQSIIDDIEHSLRCERLMPDRDGNMSWQTPKNVRPILNQKGTDRILTVLRSHLTKIFILSDLEQKQIEAMTISIGRTLIDDLYYNWDAYELLDDASASLVINVVTNTVYATLRKAYMSNYLKFLRTTQTINEIQHHAVTDRPQSAQGGDSIINRLFGKRRS